MRPSHPRLTRLARAGLGLTLATAVLAVLPAPATAAGGDTSPAASTRSQTDRAPQLRPSGLSSNGIASPVDVEGTPLFGWHVGSARQSAYRIVVASTPAAATAGEGDVWDSGTVSSDEQRGVPFAGPALATSERYFWAVQTWDGSGAPSGWSEPAQFGTGPGASWSGSAPVWAPSADRNWTDYTVEADVTVVQNAATLTFHATSTTAFNMWQLRADTDVLRTHQGTTLVEEVPLGFDLVEGETHRLRIETRGASVTTFVDDVPIRTTAAYTAHPSGGVGFRTGLTEQARFDDLSVVDSRGSVLYRNDFSAGAPELSSLSVADGELVVAAGRNDLVAGSWSAYELRARLRVDEVAAGLTFRADGAGNSYMWQFRGADNRLVPHRQTNGAYATLGSAVNLPTGTLAVGKTVEVRIRVLGSTYTTFIDGVQVDSRSDTSYRRGFIGVRNGNSEVATLDDLRVTDLLSGATLIEEDFDNGAAVFGCGSGSGGALTVGKGQACLQAGLTNDWAFLRGEVLLEDKEIAWASLFATGANARTAKQYVHKVYVNGSFVGLGPTQPIAGETRYDGFDVTGLLRSGTSNAVAALAYTTNTRKFQAELVVEYVDGTRTVFGSGEDWTALNGERVFPEAGSIGVAAYFRAPKENLDARRFPFGFDEPGYDDSAWVPAAQTTPLGTLAATPTDKVEEQLHEAVSVEQRGPGHYVLDFGRTWIGGVSYDIASGTDGARVDLRFGEVRNADGSVRYNLATGNNYQDVVTLKDGPQTLETWGARVFRYVEVVGAPEEVTADTLRALALVYPFDPDASTFTASDDDLEQVYQLSKNSIESLNLNFYTDSWTRERTNYEADGYLQQMSTLYLMDDLSLARYSMDYFKNNRTWPTEWPLYVVLAVRDAWRQTGDLTQVRDYYANLVDKLPTEWVDPATGLVGKTFRSDGCNSQTDCDIVDWPAATERDGYRFRTFNTVVNALAYRAYRDMAELAGALGRTEDQTTWTGVADRLRDAMNERLYDPATGSYDDGLDSSLVRSGHSALHASAFPLAFGVPEPGAQTAAVADHVSSLGMRCSVYCAAFVVKGLYDGGNGQAALDLLTATGTRSWMNMIALGAGSTMEAWDPSLKGNLTYSHPWAASPAFTVPAGLFGIQPASAGYDTVTVAPQPGDLEWGTIVTPTVKGSIGAAFDRTSTGELRVVASVPGNTRATVSVPTSATTATTLYVDGQPRTLTPVDGRLVVRNLSLGCHLLSPEESTDLGDHLATVCDRPLAQGATVVSQVDPAGDDGWSGAGSTLTLTLSGSTEDAVVEYRLPVGEWSVYDGPVDLPAGSYEVATRARDAEGVVVTSATTPVKVDPVAPSVTATLDGRTVTVTATDADSGVALVEHSLDGGDWTAHTAPLVLDDAAHSVEVRATDAAGNVSPIRRLDVPAGESGPPGGPPLVVTTAVEPEAPLSGWFSGPVTVTLAVSGGSGSPTLEQALDGAPWTPYRAPVVVAEEGEHVLAHRATSGSDSVSGAVTLRIDTQPPVTTAVVDEEDRSVTLTATDALSGVDRTEVERADGTWTTADAPVEVGDDEATVRFRSVDLAGNVESTGSAVVPAAGVDLSATTVTATLQRDRAPLDRSNRLRVAVVGEAGGTPTGRVEVVADGVLLGSAALVDGVAMLEVGRQRLAPGRHDLTVSYTGDAAFAASSGTLPLTLTRAVTRVGLPGSRLETGPRGRVLVRAVVRSRVDVGGRLRVVVDGSVVARPRLVDAEARVALERLAPGRHRLRVVYPGSATARRDTVATGIVVRS